VRGRMNVTYFGVNLCWPDLCYLCISVVIFDDSVSELVSNDERGHRVRSIFDPFVLKRRFLFFVEVQL
jgi:hypothetical protein